MLTPEKKRGQGLWEYALVICLITFFCVAALTGMGERIIDYLYNPIVSEIDQANYHIQNPDGSNGNGESGNPEEPPSPP